MSDLVQWLNACYDRAEQRARATTRIGRNEYAPEWRVEGEWLTEVGVAIGSTVAPGYIEPVHADHIADHDPKWRLADIARKRKILNRHQGEQYDESFWYCRTCGSGEPNEYPTPWPCGTVLLLAEEFAHEPGYDAERWAP